MKTTLRSSLLLLLAFAASAVADDEKQRLVDEQLRYLQLLDQAEAHLLAASPDAALAALEQALACHVPDSHVKYLQLETKGAVAHYLRACAYAAKDENAAALRSLQKAPANGYRNTALVKTDLRLAGVRKLPDFESVLEQFPPPKLTDRFAGKTVADRNFGISLQKHRVGNFPKLGEVAPDFELPLLGKDSENLKLSSFQGKKPVVLIFGSFT